MKKEEYNKSTVFVCTLCVCVCGGGGGGGGGGVSD